MRTAKTLLLGAATLMCLAPMALAAPQEVQGRTGLPMVKVGGEKVWMTRGTVDLNVQDKNLQVIQNYRLRYPGPPLEKGPLAATIAVREDYFRDNNKGANPVALNEARGFDDFAVYVDGQAVPTSFTDWQLNDKKDTVTRWRTWTITFQPGDVHNMRIASLAPLATWDNRPAVSFISKDLSHWRETPDYLKITLNAPGIPGTDLVAFEPDPKVATDNGLSWIYRHVQPKRDILVELPAEPGTTSHPQ